MFISYVPSLFKVFSNGGFKVVGYNMLGGVVVMVGKREGFLPWQFGGEAMSMCTRIAPDGSWCLVKIQLPVNWELKESVHLMMCLTNEAWIKAMVDDLEKAMVETRFPYELCSTLCGLFLPSQKPIKVHHWCLELALGIHQIFLWPNEIRGQVGHHTTFWIHLTLTKIYDDVQIKEGFRELQHRHRWLSNSSSD